MAAFSRLSAAKRAGDHDIGHEVLSKLSSALQACWPSPSRQVLAGVDLVGVDVSPNTCMRPAKLRGIRPASSRWSGSQSTPAPALAATGREPRKMRRPVALRPGSCAGAAHAISFWAIAPRAGARRQRASCSRPPWRAGGEPAPSARTRGALADARRDPNLQPAAGAGAQVGCWMASPAWADTSSHVVHSGGCRPLTSTVAGAVASRGRSDRRCSPLRRSPSGSPPSPGRAVCRPPWRPSRWSCCTGTCARTRTAASAARPRS